MDGAAELLRRKWRVGAFGLALVAVLGTVLALRMASEGPEPPASRPAPGSASPASEGASPAAAASRLATPASIEFAGILDGAPMSAAEWAARKDLPPLAVMVDNTANAYPHAGLAAADLVYEAFVEGGVTRLMAVYWRHDADKVSPVRSARTPFVVWALELGALYAHAGGATTWNEANAIGQIFEWGVRDLDAFVTGSSTAYYRDSDRAVPYNLVTSTAKLYEAAASLGFNGPPAAESWKFRNPGDPALGGTRAEGIEVDFQGTRSSWQMVQWKWDAAAGAYGRSAFGGPHVDAATGRQLQFATVIVMLAPGEVVDESGHVLLQQIGEGPATVFTGGHAIEGVWRKASREARTRFFDTRGQEVAFERGPIFIEVIDRQSTVVVSESAAGLPALPPYQPPPAPPVQDEDGPAPGDSPPTAVASPTPGAGPAGTPSGTAGPGRTPGSSGPGPAKTPATVTPPAASPTNPSGS